MLHLLLGSLSLLYYINAPVTAMRELPQSKSEVASEAYFSEEVRLLEEKDDWMKIETTADKYQGWVRKEALCTRDAPFLDSSMQCAWVSRSAAHLYAKEDTVYGPMLTVPFESRLQVIEPKGESNSRWIKVSLVDGQEGYIQRGDVTLVSRRLSCEEMCRLSLQFLGLPYTWGGRSSFGYDCSGFVQMLYRQMKIQLPRDTKDQIRWEGFKEVALDQLERGDLIFFGLSKDQIRHVGMCMGNNQFIHATVGENQPYIHISNLSESARS